MDFRNRLNCRVSALHQESVVVKGRLDDVARSVGGIYVDLGQSHTDGYQPNTAFGHSQTVRQTCIEAHHRHHRQFRPK